MNRLLSTERGRGYVLLVCKCGWRVMCHTDSEVTREGGRHIEFAHGLHDQAVAYLQKRRVRGQ